MFTQVKKQFHCPTAVKEYNEYMAGVDKADMLCVVHGLNRESKWWHRIFFGIIDCTLINAYVAYCKMEDSKRTTLDFRTHVTQTLINLSQPPKVGHPALSVTPPVSKKRLCPNLLGFKTEVPTGLSMIRNEVDVTNVNIIR